jgi:hypothetical protein
MEKHKFQYGKIGLELDVCTIVIFINRDNLKPLPASPRQGSSELLSPPVGGRVAAKLRGTHQHPPCACKGEPEGVLIL